MEESNISFVLPVILAQGNSRDKLSQLATQVVRWESDGRKRDGRRDRGRKGVREREMGGEIEGGKE